MGCRMVHHQCALCRIVYSNLKRISHKMVYPQCVFPQFNHIYLQINGSTRSLLDNTSIHNVHELSLQDELELEGEKGYFSQTICSSLVFTGPKVGYPFYLVLLDNEKVKSTTLKVNVVIYQVLNKI